MVVERRKKSMSVREMGRMLGLKKVESYWLVHKEYFKTILVNGKMRVLIDSFEEWYANQIKYRKIDGPPPGDLLRQKSYSAEDIGKMLGISTSYAYDIIRQEGIPTITVDYWKRVKKEDFDKWYEGQDRFLLKKERMILDASVGELISLPEMARMLDVTRSSAYSIANSAKGKKYLKEVMVGRRRHVTLESFEEWYRNQDQYLKPGDEPEDYQRKRKRYEECLTAKPVVKPRKRKTSKPSTNPDLLTIDQAAIIAGVSSATVGRWLKNGSIKKGAYSKKLIRIRREDFEEFLIQRQEDNRKDGRDGIDH